MLLKCCVCAVYVNNIRQLLISATADTAHGRCRAGVAAGVPLTLPVRFTPEDERDTLSFLANGVRLIPWRLLRFRCHDTESRVVPRTSSWIVAPCFCY